MKKITLLCWIISSMSLSAQDQSPAKTPEPHPNVRELPPPSDTLKPEVAIIPRELGPPPGGDDCCKTKKIKNPCDVSCCQPCCSTKIVKKSTKTRMPATDALLGRVKTSSYSSKNSYSRLLLGL
jgi:hypothetical protein